MSAEKLFEVSHEHHSIVDLVPIDKQILDSIEEQYGISNGKLSQKRFHFNYLKEIVETDSIAANAKIFLFKTLFVHIHNMDIKSSLIQLHRKGRQKKTFISFICRLFFLTNNELRLSYSKDCSYCICNSLQTSIAFSQA